MAEPPPGSPWYLEDVMVKKLMLLLALALGGAVALRRARSARDEQDLWQQATAAPDLR